MQKPLWQSLSVEQVAQMGAPPLEPLVPPELELVLLPPETQEQLLASQVWPMSSQPSSRQSQVLPELELEVVPEEVPVTQVQVPGSQTSPMFWQPSRLQLQTTPELLLLEELEELWVPEEDEELLLVWVPLLLELLELVCEPELLLLELDELWVPEPLDELMVMWVPEELEEVPPLLLELLWEPELEALPEPPELLEEVFFLAEVEVGPQPSHSPLSRQTQGMTPRAVFIENRLFVRP